jgi:hypothetical protein
VSREFENLTGTSIANMIRQSHLRNIAMNLQVGKQYVLNKDGLMATCTGEKYNMFLLRIHAIDSTYFYLPNGEKFNPGSDGETHISETTDWDVRAEA